MDILDTFDKQAAASAHVSDIASKATIVGGTGTSAYAFLGGDNLLSTIGIICTVATFLVNWIFKRREYRLKERKLKMEYDMQMLAEKRRQQLADAQIMAMQSGYIPLHQMKDTETGAL